MMRIVGDIDNPEYEKCLDLVKGFKSWGRGDFKEFLRVEYGLEGDYAVKLMRKVEDIVYKGYESKSEKRNRRRELRKKMFDEKFGA